MDHFEPGPESSFLLICKEERCTPVWPLLFLFSRKNPGEGSGGDPWSAAEEGEGSLGPGKRERGGTPPPLRVITLGARL